MTLLRGERPPPKSIKIERKSDSESKKGHKASEREKERAGSRWASWAAFIRIFS